MPSFQVLLGIEPVCFSFGQLFKSNDGESLLGFWDFKVIFKRQHSHFTDF
jgi:hypothetical protein